MLKLIMPFSWLFCIPSETIQSWNWSPSDQVTLRQRSGHSGVCVLLRVGKDGKCGHDHACPLPMGHCAVGPCEKHACATTLLPVQANMVSQDQVCLPNSVLFLYCKSDDQCFIICVICLILSSWGRGDRSCPVIDISSPKSEWLLNSPGCLPPHCHVEVFQILTCIFMCVNIYSSVFFRWWWWWRLLLLSSQNAALKHGTLKAWHLTFPCTNYYYYFLNVLRKLRKIITSWDSLLSLLRKVGGTHKHTHHMRSAQPRHHLTMVYLKNNKE